MLAASKRVGRAYGRLRGGGLRGLGPDDLLPAVALPLEGAAGLLLLLFLLLPVRLAPDAVGLAGGGPAPLAAAAGHGRPGRGGGHDGIGDALRVWRESKKRVKGDQRI